MRPYEGDEPEEYRGEPAGGRYRRAYRGGQQPPGGHQSPPPRGGPTRAPQGGSQSPPPQTREELARQQAGPGTGVAQTPAGQPTGGPAGQPAYPSGDPGTAVPGVGGQPATQAAPAGPAPAGAGALAPIGVGELLETEVVTAGRDTPVATVVAQMAEKNVGSVVIVEDDSPVGIVTDRRIALALESDPEVSTRRADELLTGEFVTGTTDMSVVDVLDRLAESGIRRLPIVDEDGALAGIVTLDDVLVLLSDELRNVADVVRTQSPRL